MTRGQAWKTPELANKYLSGVRGAIPLANEQIEVMMRLIKATGINVGSFLDLGSGDGILSAAILDNFPDAKAVLLDFSEPMIEAAKNKLRAYNNIDFIVYDYGDSSWIKKVAYSFPFDIVVSGFSIHHQTDSRKYELYKEIFDLLSADGLFINIEHVLSPTKWIGSIFAEYFIDSLYRLQLKQGGKMSLQEVAGEFYNRPDKEANILAPVEKQCEWLRRIGYKDVDCYFKIFELAVFGGRRVNGDNGV
ncbi:MAG: methyltransferase type 12 [Peptococcaceae bacterium BICA1-7]|nr:MAG: methyltransferase type 12 [Peptococcaceae bacterium BICA1-7]HBV95563.1 class I SAM-dependent methyltransferase [Desulfotomaculum sp.]